MTTVLKDFGSLAREINVQRPQPKLEEGNVFWLSNRTLSFDDCSEDRFHPVIVVAVDGEYVEVRIRTSRVERSSHNGMFHGAQRHLGLDKDGIILTAQEFHRRLPATALKQRRCMGNIGPVTLLLIWIYEWAMAPRRKSPIFLERASRPTASAKGALARVA